MAPKKPSRIEPRLPRGFADRGPADIRAVDRMMEKIKAVYERYGFEPVETPFVEYTEALGKFLPDQDRPGEGVFSFQDEDESWLSLRYDLTAPLARYVAQNFEALPKPYRSYRAGWVFSNEKPGPGRYRQFMQFDADTVGASSPAADAEICMMAADTMEALGFERGQYVIKVNSRKVLDGVMEKLEIPAAKRIGVLRSVDALDRIGLSGVLDRLGPGRVDASGDRIEGLGLNQVQIASLRSFLDAKALGADQEDVEASAEIAIAVLKVKPDLSDIEEIQRLVRYAGYAEDRIRTDLSVVRGLEYYTGPVFEAQLTFEVPNEKGARVVFGSVGGGGRYDGLVGRFRGPSTGSGQAPSTGSGQAQDVPATGFSVGVSRLATALKAIGKLGDEDFSGPVVITVMDRERLADYQRMVAELRHANIAAEMYLGSSGMKAQLKYADKRNALCAIIAGSSEFESGKVQIKDLAAGKAEAAAIASHQAWREERPGQFEVAQGDLVAEVRKLLQRQKGS